MIEIVRAIRNIRAEFTIQPNQTIEATVDAPEIGQALEAEAGAIRSLALVDPLRFGAAPAEANKADSTQRVSMALSMGTLTMPLGGLVDVEQEKSRLRDELEQIDTSLERLSARLRDEQFLGKAPDDVVERERQRLEGTKDRRSRIGELLSRLG